MTHSKFITDSVTGLTVKASTRRIEAGVIAELEKKGHPFMIQDGTGAILCRIDPKEIPYIR